MVSKQRTTTQYGKPFIKVKPLDYSNFPKMPLKRIIREPMPNKTATHARLQPMSQYQLPYRLLKCSRTKKRIIALQNVPKTIEVNLNAQADSPPYCITINRFGQLCSPQLCQGVEWLRNHQLVDAMQMFLKQLYKIFFLQDLAIFKCF